MHFQTFNLNFTLYFSQLFNTPFLLKSIFFLPMILYKCLFLSCTFCWYCLFRFSMCGRFSSCFHENVFAFSWSVQLFLVPKSKWILMIHILKLQDPVREHTYIHTHTRPHGRRSENIHHSLPTRPARSMVAGQGTHTHTPCLQDPHEAGQETYTHTHHTHTPCLQDQHEAWSPVREHTHTHTHTPCLQDQHEAWSPVREHTHTHYKTRTKHGRRSGSPVREHCTHTPCLQDPHEAWSPVREHYTHTPCLQDQHGREHTHTRSARRNTHASMKLTLLSWIGKSWCLTDMLVELLVEEHFPSPEGQINKAWLRIRLL